MSTNYYLNNPQGATIHIGKSSAGWQFLFNVGRRDDIDPLDSFDGWMNYLGVETRNGSVIEDEYGRPVELSELKDLIIRKQLEGKNGWTASDDVVGPWCAKRRREKLDVMETYCRKGFRFSTAQEFC